MALGWLVGLHCRTRAGFHRIFTRLLIGLPRVYGRLATTMQEKTVLLVTGLLMLAAILIPVPRRPRTILWCIMLGVIATMWIGASLGYLAPLL